MAEENRGWGYLRIQGALANLGHRVARTTVANILKRHGIAPAPERIKQTTWKEFLKCHWDQIIATDFFTVEVYEIQFNISVRITTLNEIIRVSATGSSHQTI